jgi:hypothetical protein
VDKGLRKFGYETGLYRIVFFGRPQQMAMVRENHPGLIPYLPLKIMLFEDGGSVVAVVMEPVTLADLFDDSAIQKLLDSWQKDLMMIMSLYERCGEADTEPDEISQSSLSFITADK